MAGPLQPDVVVNGEVIPAAAVAAEAQNHPAPKGKPGLAWRAAARALAIRALLLHEARRRGLEPDPREISPGRRETDEEALARAVIEASVAVVAPTEAEARALYDADPERFRGPSLYEPAHILFPAAPGDAAAQAAAEAAARAALAEIAGDARAFERVARRESACPSREAGGRLGQIVAGDTVPEFEAALDAAAEGAVHPEPVATRYGWHVIQLDARLPGAVPPFAAVRRAILVQLEKTAWARAARAFTARLADGAALSGVDLGRAA